MYTVLYFSSSKVKVEIIDIPTDSLSYSRRAMLQDSDNAVV